MSNSCWSRRPWSRRRAVGVFLWWAVARVNTTAQRQPPAKHCLLLPPHPPHQTVNKLLYRSKQRGFLELDLLVGLWAERQLPRMSAAALAEFATVLDEVGGWCGGRCGLVSCGVM